jgi:hypothetical protein
MGGACSKHAKDKHVHNFWLLDTILSHAYPTTDPQSMFLTFIFIPHCYCLLDLPSGYFQEASPQKCCARRSMNFLSPSPSRCLLHFTQLLIMQHHKMTLFFSGPTDIFLSTSSYLFTAHIRTMSITQTTRRQIIGRIMKTELERVRRKRY